MTPPPDLRRIRPTSPGSRALTALLGRLRWLLVSGTGTRRRIIHDQDGRHLVPPVRAARCLIVEAPRDLPELAGRPTTFEGFRLADGSYVGWQRGAAKGNRRGSRIGRLLSGATIGSPFTEAPAVGEAMADDDDGDGLPGSLPWLTERAISAAPTSTTAPPASAQRGLFRCRCDGSASSSSGDSSLVSPTNSTPGAPSSWPIWPG